MKTLSFNTETLRDLTPDEALKTNGGVMMTVAQTAPAITAFPMTGPVAQPTSTVRTGPTPITAPVHHRRHHHHHHR